MPISYVALFIKIRRAYEIRRFQKPDGLDDRSQARLQEVATLKAQ